MKTRIGLIGDHDPSVPAHRAIPLALEIASGCCHIDLEPVWIDTDAVTDSLLKAQHFDGIWCVPASPYRSTEGALAAIRFARERRIPFLGTCGGFQHALLETARHVLGDANASHEELTPSAISPWISRLTCPLIEVSQRVVWVAGNWARETVGAPSTLEDYHCNFGLAPARENDLFQPGRWLALARDESGQLRAAQYGEHPFFVGTLFQPERWALRGKSHRLIEEFVRVSGGASPHRRQSAASTVSPPGP